MLVLKLPVPKKSESFRRNQLSVHFFDFPFTISLCFISDTKLAKKKLRISRVLLNYFFRVYRRFVMIKTGKKPKQ